MIDIIIKGAITRKTTSGSVDWNTNSIKDNNITGSSENIMYKGLYLGETSSFPSKLDILTYNYVTEYGDVISSMVQINDSAAPDSTEEIYTFNPANLYRSSNLEIQLGITRPTFNLSTLSVVTPADNNFTKTNMNLIFKNDDNQHTVPSGSATPVNLDVDTNRIIRDGWYSLFSIYSTNMPLPNPTSPISHDMRLVFHDSPNTAYERLDFFWFPDLRRVSRSLLELYTSESTYGDVFTSLKCKTDAIEHFIRVGKLADAQYIIQSTKHLQLKFKAL